MTSLQPVPVQIVAAQRLIVEGVREHLHGLLVNADDALFELAARSEDDQARRRCFDLARLLRQQRDALIENFCRAMHRADRMWGRREFRIHEVDADWLAARQLGEHVHLHFAPLLSSLARNVGRLLNVQVDDPEALPISPTCVGAAYLESRRQIAQYFPDAMPQLDRLFVRFVVDRLGGLYGEVLTTLEAPAALLDPR